MENLNNSPLLILRQNNKQFKQKQKLLNKRIKNKKHLREQIYSNHNIFQSSINLYRSMTAQNIIWDKNYNYKTNINQLKQENNSLKARIWNVEKENRKMERQIETWNLNSYYNNNLGKKPYIDMATMEKVVTDQDYNIVSMKMQIFQLEKQLQDRDSHYQKMQERGKDFQKVISYLNHQIALRKVQVCKFIQMEEDQSISFEKQSKQKMSRIIMNQNQQLDLIAKNIEIKKKSKINIQNDLRSISTECELQKNITYSQIQRLNEEVRNMRLEEDGGVSVQKQKLRLAKKAALDYECFMQTRMGDFIKQKIPLQLQIEEVKDQLAKINLSLKEPNKNKDLM